MNVGIGYDNSSVAFVAGQKAATKAVQNGGINKYDLALAFCSGDLNHSEYLNGVKDVIGDTPVIGGSTMGIITNDELNYKDHPSGVVLLQSNTNDFQVASAEKLDIDPFHAGYNFASKLTPSTADRLLLMFYDSIKKPATSTTPPLMNASPPLIDGIESVFPSSTPIIGAGVISGFEFSATEQFYGANTYQQTVVGALLSGDINIYYSKIHGCSPIDGRYHTITKMSKDNIYELDGRSIVEVIDELYGSQKWRKEFPLKLLTIGVNYGEKYQPQGNSYVNRLITGILPDGKGIGLFEPDLQEGMEIQFMLRDGNLMLQSAKENSEELLTKVKNEGKTPVFGLYIDCAGRAAEYSNTQTEEAAEIQKTMNKHSVPLFGFYSGVEVAPIDGRSRGLDWTGVLMILAKDKR
jgi:hypothetical protein